MAKLYFKYGAMGSSKTAQALITKYNYEENDMKVWLIKPSADTRDGKAILRSRIGLEARVEIATRTGESGTTRFVFNNSGREQTFTLDGEALTLAPFEMHIDHQEDRLTGGWKE